MHTIESPEKMKPSLLMSMKVAIICYTIIASIIFYGGIVYDRVALIFLCLCLSLIIFGIMMLHSEVKADEIGAEENDEIAG